MNRKLKKDQKPQRLSGLGVVIDCLEFVIMVFPPPREHGKPHCHVRSKRLLKPKGRSVEVQPELKVFLDGSGFIEVVKGFSKRDFDTIGKIIFNDPQENEISNVQFLLMTWERLHD